MRRLPLLAVLIAGLVAAPPAEAQVPADHQAALLLRILAYDRNVRTRADSAVTVVVLHGAGEGESEKACAAVENALATLADAVTVSGLPVRVESLAYHDAAAFESAVATLGAAAVYVCPGLGQAIPALSEVTRRRSLLSFTSVEEHVREGLGIGIVRRGARAAVVVNIPAARAEGASLDAGLLQLAEVVR